jgi:hypothetical protein
LNDRRIQSLKPLCSEINSPRQIIDQRRVDELYQLGDFAILKLE